MSLVKYNQKRDFKITKEPPGKLKKSGKGALSFVVQEHHASHLHWDFRLEWEGVLKSWAVPKGPSMDPHIKRLAVETEDHPLSYGSFHGTIPEDQYGGGEVYIWDKGTWEPEEDAAKGFKKGHLVFSLKGKKLKGVFHLVRTRTPGRTSQWLLMKKDDAFAEAVPEIKPVAEAKHTPRRAVAKKVVKKKVSRKSAKVAKLPFVTPELALLVDEPPEGKEWLHELKFDGYRVQAHVNGDEVKLFTRSGQDWTAKFPVIARDLQKLDVEGAVIDGEIVILDKSGRSDFQLLQNALKSKQAQNMYLYAFDLLAVNGKDLRTQPLEQRRDELVKIFKKSAGRIRYSEEYQGTGKSLLAQAKKHGLEGIISKKRNSPYRSERNSNWLKIKCSEQQEFVIGGYTLGKGSRDHFGALLLGVYKKDKLQYVGKVGTGFTQQSLRDVFKTLKPLETQQSPFDIKSPKGRDIHWLKPKYSAQITFSNWTHEEILRVPVFNGLREDKPTKQIKKETPVALKSSEEWPISSPDKILFAKEKITKRQVANFYTKVAEHILPLITDRPLSLVRCPNGTGKQCFFQKHQAKIPESMTPVKMKEHGGYGTYMSVHDDAGLAALVQMNAFEIHCSNSRHPETDVPDQFVMDFDPGPGVGWKTVVDAAFNLKKLLEGLGLKSFVKLSGGKGVHVHVPVAPIYTFDQINSFTHALALQMEQQDPDLFVSKMSKKIREGRIFVDYLRNSQGATAVAPYSLRARAISAVAMPVTWNDLKKIPGGDYYDLKKALAHLQRRRSDPWQGYLKLQQRIALLEKATTKKKLYQVSSAFMKAWTSYRPKPVIGVDEVGRGSLAGPVFAAAVVLKHERLPKFLKDSKLLSRKQRIDVFREICREHRVAIGIATVEEIALLNIVFASTLAMKRAVSGLKLKKGHVLVDGRLRIPVLPKEFQQTPVVKGDLLFAPVSAASIIAKVARDELMAELGKEFPQYGWQHNAGYATASHIKALREYGPCRLHRKSFSQVSLPFIF